MMEKTKSCIDCLHMDEYVLVTNNDHNIQICSAEGWDDNEDGAYCVVEVSGFDATQCTMFKKR